ncbi:hypothetical protein N7535_000288 [Penicillium sp. DV-2018c]|nr:hypothetical protein N7535_000288 [Penicillium sp. DV-2018c]
MAYASLQALPLELWGSIESHLSNADLKSLRLACKQFNNSVSLRFDRVFLSANSLKIEVFRNIASHDKFRHRVDAFSEGDVGPHYVSEWAAGFDPPYQYRTAEPVVFKKSPVPEECRESREYLSDEDEAAEEFTCTRFDFDYVRPDWDGILPDEYYPGWILYGKYGIKPYVFEPEDVCPKWFRYVIEETHFLLKYWRDYVDPRDRMDDRIAGLEQVFAQPEMGERWRLYEALLRQQEEVLAGQSDLEAFAFGVKQFPALKRVTITPAPHGNIIIPLEMTPTTHAFPKGFNYPIRQTWLYPSRNDPASAFFWHQYPELGKRYRGFRAAMRVLANEPNCVSELVITPDSKPVGILSAMFDEPFEEYNDFVALLKQPGFRRLDLALFVGDDNQEYYKLAYRGMRNGRLRQALGEAKDMEEFTLNTTFANNRDDKDSLIPLESILPVKQWTKLHHFGLSGFRISQDDLLSFLKALPKSVRSIELNKLYFARRPHGTWYGMLEELKRMVREGSLWGDRDAESRPKLSIGVPYVRQKMHSYWLGHCTRIDKEVEEFIYGEGENPFQKKRPYDIVPGVGVHTLEPDYEPQYVQVASGTFCK